MNNFSLGMKQRLGIAKALLGEPEFFKISKIFNYKVLMLFSLILGISNGRLMIQKVPAITGKDMFSIIGMGSIYALMLVESNTQNPTLINVLRVTFVYQVNDLRYGYHTIHNPFWFIAVSALALTGIWLFLAFQIFRKSELK